MGLDIYAVTNPDVPDPEAALAPAEAFRGVPAALAGGFFAEGGVGPYFRGTAYAGYVAAATGRSLYQEEAIPPAVAEEMARRLEEAAAAGRYREFGIDDAGARALAAWFRACAENGFHVRGCW